MSDDKVNTATDTAVATKSDVEIAKTILGRKRKEYQQLAELGKSKQVIRNRMKDDALLFGITLDDYVARLEELNKPTSEGKRQKDDAQRVKFAKSDNLCIGYENQLQLIAVDAITPEFAVDFCKGLQTAILERSEIGYYGKGMVALRAIPRIDLSTINNPNPELTNPDKLQQVLDCGWSDGSKKERHQYFARQIPASKASGYNLTWEFPKTPEQAIEINSKV